LKVVSILQLLLLKRGGQVIYAGELGHQSKKLVEYFEVLQPNGTFWHSIMALKHQNVL
jgi:hypothetical protein